MMKEKLPVIIPLVLLAIVVGILVYQKIQYYRTIKALTSIEPQQVTTFKIYPKCIRPVGIPREFTASEPLINEFFQSLTDLRSYWPKHNTVASQAHSWFLEIATEGETIQISCYIPSRKGDIVVGKLSEFREGGGGPHYGHFQSRKLFQWYQTYSHRWLEAGSK